VPFPEEAGSGITRLRLAVGYTVLVLFIASVAAAIVQNARDKRVDLETLLAIQGMMGIVCGALFAPNILKGPRGRR